MTYEAFGAAGFPTIKHEAWRFTPLHALIEDHVMAADGHAGDGAGQWAEGVDAEFAGGGFRDIQGGLVLRDRAGRHHKMDVLLRLQAEFAYQVGLGKAENLSRLPLNDRAEQFAGAVIEDPDGIGLQSLNPGQEPDPAGAEDEIFVTGIARFRHATRAIINRSPGQAQKQPRQQPDEAETTGRQRVYVGIGLKSVASEAAAAVSETTTTVEEVRQTSHVASQKAKQVAESAQRAAQSSHSGRKSIDDVTGGMNRIRVQMDAIAASMVRLSEQGQAIVEKTGYAPLPKDKMRPAPQ